MRNVDEMLEKYNEAIKLTYNYTLKILMSLKRIRDNLKEINNPDEITIEVYRDSIIKKYETLEDLSWKLLSKIFKASGLDINNPRGCYKQAYKEGLIQDIDIWNEILLSRNSTAHVYDEKDYEDIKNRIVEVYIDAIEELLENISSKVIL
ncbi:MAG: HI0074 family nucleotidyltransferase substrate-binding subunit [Clostridium sp.]